MGVCGCTGDGGTGRCRRKVRDVHKGSESTFTPIWSTPKTTRMARSRASCLEAASRIVVGGSRTPLYRLAGWCADNNADTKGSEFRWLCLPTVSDSPNPFYTQNSGTKMSPKSWGITSGVTLTRRTSCAEGWVRIPTRRPLGGDEWLERRASAYLPPSQCDEGMPMRRPEQEPQPETGGTRRPWTSSGNFSIGSRI